MHVHQLRVQYARLCVELPMDQPIAKYIYIEVYKQLIEYEGEKMLCKKCEMLGHSSNQCPCIINSLPEKSITGKATTNHQETQKAYLHQKKNGWHTMSFHRSRRLQKKY